MSAIGRSNGENRSLHGSLLGTGSKEIKPRSKARKPRCPDSHSQYNMDSVDTLCRLVPGVEVHVPYLNTVILKGYFAYLTQAEQFADIREWFPTNPKGMRRRVVG